MTCHTWHVTCDMWHVTRGTWRSTSPIWNNSLFLRFYAWTIHESNLEQLLVLGLHAGRSTSFLIVSFPKTLHVFPSNTPVHAVDILINNSDTLVHTGLSLGIFPHWQGLKGKDFDEPEFFCIILVSCTQLSMEIDSFVKFCTVYQNSKTSYWWPPN